MAEKSHYSNVVSVYDAVWCYKEDGDCQKHLCREGVEPSEAMAAEARKRGLAVVVAGALEWATSQAGGPKTFDTLLLKEVRHHFDDPETVYRELLNGRLSAGGRIIILTRPDVSNGYPFPAAAHIVWEVSHKEIRIERHLEALKAAGFQDIEVLDRPFSVEMPREAWENLLRSRFWSNLSPLSEEEMEDGIVGLALPEVVQFDDKYLFIVANKPV